MAALSLDDMKQKNLAPISGVVTAFPISREFSVMQESSINFRCDIVCSGVAVVGAITARLQHRTLGGTFANLASANSIVTISANGTASIVLHVERAADQADLPVRKMCQIVLTTTNAGDAVTIDHVVIQQP